MRPTVYARHILIPGAARCCMNNDTGCTDAACTCACHDCQAARQPQEPPAPQPRTLEDLYQMCKALVETDLGEYFSRSYNYEADMAATSPRTAREMETRGFGPLTGTTPLEDIRYRWISIYPVTGGSEGHYVHVDLIWQREYKEGRVSLFLGKTFNGMDCAVAVAGKLALALERIGLV